MLADCHLLGSLKYCHVLLHKNALVPWFILVPEVSATDLLEIPALQRNRIMEECAALAGFIKHHFYSTKINFAAIGNLVPQLHLHIIGRSVADACWPKPVWGNLESDKTYSDSETDLLRRELRITYNMN